jgi:hypothetical protein
MKKILALTAFATLGASAAFPALAETGIGVSIGINEPGVYGRVDFGTAEPPPVLYSRPVVIERDRDAWRRPPVYLYVPTAHAQNWAYYCGSYSACGQPVYFVQEQWVQQRYATAHRGWRDDRRDHDRRDWRDHDRRDWRDRDEERRDG